MDNSGQLKVLADLSNRAIKEFDEAQKKCKEFNAKYLQQHDKNQKLTAQFKQLKRVSLLAVSEYENLMKTYTDAVKLKDDTLNKLKKVEDENKELRKVNKISPNVAILPTTSEKGAGDAATKGELEGLRALLTGTKEEIRRAKAAASKLESQLAEETREHESTKKKLNTASAQIQQLNRVSFLALDEFQELKKKYDAEVECRKKAEEYASEVLHDNQSMLRKSKVFSENAPGNEKLDKALQEIEELSQTLSKERLENTRKMKDIQEELDSSKETNALKALEEKMSVTLDQIELLQRQLQESEQRAHESDKRARELYDKLIRTEEALMSSPNPSSVVIAAATPPPPPPPPPPIPAPMMRKFITRIGGGKKKKKGSEKDKDDPIQDMMKEMMSRINKGLQLKSSNTKDDSGTAPAMNELANLLTNLRHGKGGTEQAATEPEKEKVPEFQKFKLKKVSVAQEKTKPEEQKVDDELMKKLNKQKKVAESEVPTEENVATTEECGHLNKRPSVIESVDGEGDEKPSQDTSKKGVDKVEDEGKSAQEGSDSVNENIDKDASDQKDGAHEIEGSAEPDKRESVSGLPNGAKSDLGAVQAEKMNEEVHEDKVDGNSSCKEETTDATKDAVKEFDDIFDEINQFLGE